MKKILLPLLALLTIISFSSCELLLAALLNGVGTDDDGTTTTSTETLKEGYMWVSYENTSTKTTSFKQVPATLEYSGTYCNIYYWNENKSCINLTSDNFKTLAEGFDSFYKKECEIFGSNVPKNVFNNIIEIKSSDKINILCFDIDKDAPNSNSSSITYGYFYPLDLYKQEYISSSSYKTYKSNQKQMFYVDSYILQQNPDGIISTLSHEFQHLLNFVNKVLNINDSEKEVETWFNEMQSMLAEEILQKTLNITDEASPKSRLKYFNCGSRYGFNSIWGSVLSGTFDYANSYSFGTWLMHTYGSTYLINEIATNNYVNFDAILKALANYDYNKTKEELLSEWSCWYIKNTLQNNSSFSDFQKYPLDEINLSDWPMDAVTFNQKLKDSDNNETSKLYTISNGPYIYQYDAQVDIEPTGFTVHYLGKAEENGTTFNFTLPSSTLIKTYLYLDNSLIELTNKSYTTTSSLADQPVYLIKVNTSLTTKVEATYTGKAKNKTYTDIEFSLLGNNNTRSINLESDNKPIILMGRNLDINDLELGEVIINEETN